MRHHHKGFTLIEILIVVVIIGIIAAIAVPNLLQAMQRSKRSRTMADIKAIATALAMYRSAQKSGSQPPAGTVIPIADLLPSEYYRGSTKDPWGGDFLFTSTPNEFIIMSYGKDRTSGATTGGEFDSDIILKNGQFVAPAAAIGK